MDIIIKAKFALIARRTNTNEMRPEIVVIKFSLT